MKNLGLSRPQNKGFFFRGLRADESVERNSLEINQNRFQRTENGNFVAVFFWLK